jgi:inorganic pyrophosphatase/exopolyphosphatase
LTHPHLVTTTGDCKEFSFKTDAFQGTVGFSVVETTDDEVILSRKEELIIELVNQRSAKSIDVLFFAVVNIVSLRSTLLVCGDNERSLSTLAFPTGKMDGGSQPFSMDLGGLVSRKKDFIPAVTKAIKSGWAL